VRQEVADSGPAALLGGQQDAVLAHIDAGRESVVEEGLDRILCLCGRQAVGKARMVGKARQGGFPGMLPKTSHVPQHRPGLTQDAGAGGQHQEAQDGEEPERVIDRVKAQLLENRKPERAELVEIVVVGFVLLDHRPDDGGDAEKGQQADREAHRAEQFVERARVLRCRMALRRRRWLDAVEQGLANEKGVV
jgi:hypothetical protein